MIYYFIAGTAILLLLFIILESFRENRTVTKKEYNINTNGRAGGTRFAFISDFHLAENGRLNDKIFDIIDNVCPDFVISAGDMVVGNSSADEVMAASSLLNRISEKYPVFMANGNHELKLEENRPDVFKEYRESLKGVNWLSNEFHDINDNLRIYGLDIERKYYNRFETHNMSAEYIEGLFKSKPDNDKYSIMIAHDPEYFEIYAQYGADLILSGHYHGGIVRIPFIGGVISPRLRIFPKYSYGKFTKNGSNMIVTGGLGSHSIKLRLFNVPEVVFITLN